MNAVPGSGRLRADFSGRVVLVTGAAQGIGAAIARRFAESDAFVALADLNGEAAAAQADALASTGGDARVYRVDAASRDELGALVAAVERDGGRLDVVIHNAAYFPLTPFTQIDEATLDRTLSVNLSALFWLAQAALPAFERAGAGRLLVTSSVTGPRVVYPGLAHYAASKAGVNGFIRAAALELARRNVTVNGVEPGMIRTPAAGNLGDASVAAQIARDIPLARMGEPEDIANAMLFRLGGRRLHHGQTIVVDGGATLPESGRCLGLSDGRAGNDRRNRAVPAARCAFGGFRAGVSPASRHGPRAACRASPPSMAARMSRIGRSTTSSEISVEPLPALRK